MAESCRVPAVTSATLNLVEVWHVYRLLARYASRPHLVGRRSGGAATLSMTWRARSLLRLTLW